MSSALPAPQAITWGAPARWSSQPGLRVRVFLLADTKTGEYFAQEIVGTKATGDLLQGLVGQAQLFGEQVQRRIGLRRMLGRQAQMLMGAAQGIDMAAAGNEHALGRGLPTSPLQQHLAQVFQALACAGRERECHATLGMGFGGLGCLCRRIGLVVDLQQACRCM